MYHGRRLYVLVFSRPSSSFTSSSGRGFAQVFKAALILGSLDPAMTDEDQETKGPSSQSTPQELFTPPYLLDSFAIWTTRSAKNDD
ncbi:uncharacterized protein BDW70DRAFT_55379 [Aspergillus foveolatus]|uniref:uncharacterized protein n=1 Tax=Aspergillus foveolatus TaxID=210207 RepID=UPI003CCCCEEC